MALDVCRQIVAVHRTSPSTTWTERHPHHHIQLTADALNHIKAASECITAASGCTDSLTLVPESAPCIVVSNVSVDRFYARKQLLLSARLSHRNSVCPSVRLSHGWIRQKRSKLRSPNLQRRLPGRL